MAEFPNTTEGLIDKLIYFNEATVTKEEILGRLDALAVMEGEDRDKAVQDYFMELAIHVFHDVSKFRERASNDETLLKEGQAFPTMTAQSALVYVRDVFNKFFEDKGIKDYEGKEHFGVPQERIRDEIVDACSRYNALNELETAGRERKLDVLEAMLDYAERTVKRDYRYTGGWDETDYDIKEMYVIYATRAEQYKNRSFRWKLANIREAYRTSRFLSRTEKALKKLGFDVKSEGENVMASFSTMAPRHMNSQIETARLNYDLAMAPKQQEVARVNIPELTVGREKFQRAQKYYANQRHPDRTFYTQVSGIIDKYNLPRETVTEITSVSENYSSAAREFDTARKTTVMEGHVLETFRKLSEAFLKSALEKNEPLDIKQIINDANDFLVKECQTFSVFYEHDEMKEFAKLGLLRHANLAYFKKQVNEAIKDMNPDEVARIQKEMQETIDDHINNRDAHYEKEMEQLGEIGPMVDPLNADELVAIFNETNRIEINSETLLEEIRVALEPKNLENRDRMIRDVVYHNYLKDARPYERQRQMAKLQLLQNPTDFSTMHALREMQDIPTFFEKYVEIVSTMVKEEAPDYQMKPMAGLSKEDALHLQTNHFSSFSFKKALEIQLLQVLKLDNPDLLSVVTLGDVTTDPKTLDYKNESAEIRRRLQETYLGKKIVEDHLKSQGFFWKLGNRAEVKLMKNFIKAAEDTLAAAKFPDSAKEAAEERGLLGVDYKELSVIRSRTDDIFLTPEEKELRRQKQEAREQKQALIKAANEKPLDDRFFDIHFRPPFSLAEFNEQYHRMKEIGKECISGYDGLGKAKEVFTRNYKKFEAIKDVVRGKKHMSVDREIEFKKNAVKDFEKSEDEFLKENADYEAITYDQAKSMAKKREQAPASTEQTQVRSTIQVNLDDNNLKKEEVAPMIVKDELKKDDPVINK